MGLSKILYNMDAGRVLDNMDADKLSYIVDAGKIFNIKGVDMVLDIMIQKGTESGG